MSGGAQEEEDGFQPPAFNLALGEPEGRRNLACLLLESAGWTLAPCGLKWVAPPRLRERLQDAGVEVSPAVSTGKAIGMQIEYDELLLLRLEAPIGNG